MAEIINLRSVRKAKQRSEKEGQAQANRALFGRTKGQKQRDALEKEQARKLVDGQKLEKGERGEE